MRVVLHVGKLLVVLLLAWLIVLIFFTGPLLRNNESEEQLAKKLLDTQGEVWHCVILSPQVCIVYHPQVLALKKERDALKRLARDGDREAGAVGEEPEAAGEETGTGPGPSKVINHFSY